MQPEEQARFQGQGQTNAGAEQTARGGGIPRSGGETASGVSRSSNSNRAAGMASRAAGARGTEIWELETGRGGGGDGC